VGGEPLGAERMQQGIHLAGRRKRYGSRPACMLAARAMSILAGGGGWFWAIRARKAAREVDRFTRLLTCFSIPIVDEIRP
jgi:hypothetical protein